MLIIKCIACDQNLSFRADRNSFPLCRLCKNSLLPCPKLCKTCGSPACVALDSAAKPLEECLRPWICHEGIDSFSALYLILNSQFYVLRKWKKSRGLLFDRQVLKLNAELADYWKSLRP